MAKFCTKCGRPLTEGEVCNCAAATANNTASTQQDKNTDTVNINVTQVASNVSAIWTAFKNKIGLGDPLTNERDAFEKGLKIVPDCVKPNDSEIPVRQYQIATLRNRIACITYTKAYGRIQVTNKRVIFRAPGRCLAGRTTLQHEFAIDEIAGIEARREYVFNFWDLLLGLFLFSLGGGAAAGICLGVSDNMHNLVLASIFALLFAAGAGALFVLIKKKWALKLLGLGAGTVPAAAVGLGGLGLARYGFGGSEFFCIILVIIALIGILFSLFTLFVYSIRPNLAVIIKTKSASEAIDIRRKKKPLLGSIFGGGQSDKDDHTGYTEIWPDVDAEISIHEIGAMINDIQKLGDFGIEKWKQ